MDRRGKGLHNQRIKEISKKKAKNLFPSFFPLLSYCVIPWGQIGDEMITCPLCTTVKTCFEEAFEQQHTYLYIAYLR